MLKKLLIFLVVASVLGAGYFTYKKWVEEANLSLWSFVPSNSAIVFEPGNVKQTLDYLKNQQSWRSLALIPEIDGIYQDFEFLDSLMDVNEGFVDFLDQTPLLITVHNTGKSTFDYLFLAQINNIESHARLNQIQEGYLKMGFRKKKRRYLDFTITELYNPQGIVFTYIFYKNFFIGSTSAFLVEDAIRTEEEDQILSFRETFPNLGTVAKLTKDQGNIYLNHEQLIQLASVFTSLQLNPRAHSSFLDLTFSDQSIEMTGFSFAGKSDFLSRIQQINGSAFELPEVISNATSVFHHFSFDDISTWKNNLSMGLNTKTQELRQQLISAVDFDVAHVYDLLDDEVGLSIDQSKGRTLQTLFLKHTSANDALDYLNGVIIRYINRTQDSVFTDTYRGFVVRELPIPQFPTAFLGSLVIPYENCYFSSHRNYTFFSNSLPELKKVIDDIVDENTWEKSLRKSRFLEQINQQAAYSLFINVPGGWDHLSKMNVPKYQEFFLSNDYVFKSYENIALQYSAVDDKYFTNIFINQPDRNVMGEASFKTLESITFAESLATKPYLIRNHNDASLEVVVQDTSRVIYHIDSDFKALWSKELDGPIIGKVLQLDYYNNGKLQLAFITPDAVHLIDRTGEYIPGFPKKIEGSRPFVHFDVIDYDGSKTYRLSVVDEDGNIYLTDKDVSPLDGWNPKSFEQQVVSPVSHYRIGGTDVFPIVLANGELHLISRRGREFPGFPVSLQEPINSTYNLNPGSNFASTEWSIITQNGQLVQVNLKGRLLKRDQFVMPSTSTKFDLINDVSGNDFLITRRTENQLQLLKLNQTQLFQKEYLSDQEIFNQYYRLGAGKNIVVLGDPASQFVYLYDLSGRLVTNRPIRATQPVSMFYYEKKDEHHIYLVNENEVMLIQIN